MIKYQIIEGMKKFRSQTKEHTFIWQLKFLIQEKSKKELKRLN